MWIDKYFTTVLYFWTGISRVQLWIDLDDLSDSVWEVHQIDRIVERVVETAEI